MAVSIENHSADRGIVASGPTMVENGLVRSIRQMAYRPAYGGADPVEVMSIAQLRGVNSGHTQRADFCVVAIIDAGRGGVSIDVAHHDLIGRSIVWIPPGAVHRWDDIAELGGTVVVFRPTAPVTPATRARAADPVTVAGIAASEWRLVAAARDHLVTECATDDAHDRGIPAILLSALIARLPAAGHPAGSGDRIFESFRAAVERHFRDHHDVAFYAGELGYASTTLRRAAQPVTGMSAKAYIVERVVLEAKRILLHEDWTAARCARELGFRDASRFSVFFRDATGLRPGQWRDTQQV